MPLFILASNSPRRKNLLEQVHYSFTIQPSSIEEEVDETLSPARVVEQLAAIKAEDVWTKNQAAVVLGADTVVSFGGEILGKPSSEEDAKKMLQLLSGNTHQVYTGVAIYSRDRVTIFHEKTDVEFYQLSEEDITMYIKSNEPFDKAGAYGIQGLGAYFVKQIVGDYFNVVGLPLAKTMRSLMDIGIRPTSKLNSPAES